MTDSRPIHSVVLVKQVPDTHNITGEVMTKDGTMNRNALPAIFNPEDLNALEMALADQGAPRRHRHRHHHGPAQGGQHPARVALCAAPTRSSC